MMVMRLLLVLSILFTQNLWAQSCTQLRDCLAIASKLSGISFILEKGVIEGNPKVKGQLYNPDNSDSLLTDLLVDNKLALEITGSPNLYKIIKLPAQGMSIETSASNGIASDLHPALLVEMSYVGKDKKKKTQTPHVRQARTQLKAWRDADK